MLNRKYRNEITPLPTKKKKLPEYVRQFHESYMFKGLN